MRTLMPHQPVAVEFLKARTRALLADDTGLGKTTEAIASLPPHAKVCIICPAVVRFVWVRELVEWGIPIENIRAVVKGSDAIFDRQYTIISYALARGIDWSKHKFDYVIADESHNLKNINGKTVEATLPAIMRADVAYFLSATPVKNYFDELYTTARHIVPPRVLASEGLGNYYQFRARFCELRTEDIFVRGGMRRRVTTIVGNKNAAQLLDIIKPNFLKRRKADVLKNFPSLSWQPFYVNVRMSDEKERNQAGLTIDPEAKTLPGPIMALRIGSAMALVDTAVEIVKDHVENAKDPILVFCYHVDPIAAMAAQIPGSRVITGKTSAAERQAIVDDFQAGLIPALFAQTIAAGVGLTLHRAKDVLFVDLPWNEADAVQARDRVHRIGQTRDVIARYLVNVADKVSLRVAEIVSAKIAAMEFG